MLPEEEHVRNVILKCGPLPAFRQLIAENDALIRAPDLDHGRLLAAARTAIYTGLVREWAQRQQEALGYNRPFAVAALGGTGRGEMAPYSDNDFAFLFEDALEGNPFLLELQRQTVHTKEFEKQHGFACLVLPFSLEDVPNLSGKQLNAFLDLRPVHDPLGLADVFRERIRSTFDPFEHFLHVRGFWKVQWEKAARESERLDRFDIKHEGLRVFLAGVWTLAGHRFQHSREIYQALDDPRDLEAYNFLLRIRAVVHSRRSGPARPLADGHHAEDVLEFDDFTSFGDLLGAQADERSRFEYANEVRARLLSARRRVARFTKGVIERVLKDGRETSRGSAIVYGVGGLYHACADQARTPQEKSRAALSLLLASQRYGVPIDLSELQRTFRNAGDWLVRVPELAALFYEPRGSLADSFQFLSQLDGAEERLFPGYAKFESSLDGRVMTERRSLRGALERQKVRALEQFVEQGRRHLTEAALVSRAEATPQLLVATEAARLDADHLAAVKLALKTKRLPLTEDDLAVRRDEQRPLHERYATGLSEIPLADYYQPYLTQCDFSRETVRVAQFLVANRRAFKERAQAGLNDAQQVDEFVGCCPDEALLRSLFVFTCADRAEWESEEAEPARWFNIRELYGKAMMRFKPAPDPTGALLAAGYSSDELSILRDFGEDFFGGVYRQYAIRFGAHLVRLAQDPESTDPKASLLRDGASTILGVAARDYRGLAASISGAFWHHQVELRQAHLFSATQHGLALDFFHVVPGGAKAAPTELTESIEEAIRQRRYISEEDEANLPRLAGNISLREWRPGQYCLRLETSQDVSGLIYALTYKVYRHLRGNIFGLSAHAARGTAYVSVYHNLPPEVSLESAQGMIPTMF